MVPDDAVQRAVDGLDGEHLCFLSPGLQVRLVELDDVRARREQVAHLFIDSVSERERQRFFVVVVIVLRLLRHREGTGQRRLDPSRCVRT